MKTVPVAGTLWNPDGSRAAGAAVAAQLTAVDTDGGIIVPTTVSTTAASDGTFTLNLWPNSRGVNGSQYRVRAQMPGALPGVLLMNLLITVPDSDPSVPVPIEVITNRTGPTALSDAKSAMLGAQGFSVQALAAAAAVSEDLSTVEAAQEDVTQKAQQVSGDAATVSQDRQASDQSAQAAAASAATARGTSLVNALIFGA